MKLLNYQIKHLIFIQIQSQKKKRLKIRKFCYKNKIDICIQNSKDRKKKILFSDMDATIIKNETLDDLVKIAGTKLNIDETSKLAMEGKISLKRNIIN